MLVTLSLACGVDEGGPEPVDAIGTDEAGLTVLFSEDFSAGLARWSHVDDGNTSAPSAWSVNTGAAWQASNIYSGTLDPADPSRLGTWLVAGDPTWGDYAVTLRLRSDDDDDVGVMFRVSDGNNYYRFSMNKQYGFRRLVKRVNGTFTVLASDAQPYASGQWYTVRLEAVGGRIRVIVDDVILFDVQDAALVKGRVALYTWGDQGARFDDVQVTALTAATVSDVVWENGFDAPLTSGFQIVDEPTATPASNWTVSNGVLYQSSNTFSGSTAAADPVKPGTYLLLGDPAAQNYAVSVRVRSDDNDDVGVIFRYVDANNYYRFSMDSERAYRRLVKKVAGAYSVLGGDGAMYSVGQWYTLRVEARGTLLRVLVDGREVVRVTDAALAAGRVGLYTWGDQGAAFDDLRVERLRPITDQAMQRDACAFAAGATPQATFGDLTALRGAITHIIVLTQENRSFDHMYGRDGVGEGFPPSYTSLTGTGRIAPHTVTTACLSDVPHDWSSTHDGWHLGAMDAWAVRGGANTLAYYTPADHPFYSWLLSSFATSDRYFCAVLGPTFPNRDYLYAGTSAGLQANYALPGSVPTVFTQLSAKGVSWGDYYDGNSYLDGSLGWSYGHPGVKPFTTFFSDLSAGALPHVTFVDTKNDEHPPNSIHDGENFVRSVIAAAMQSPLWPHLAIVVNYDEGGGFFDHVPPPSACLAAPSEAAFDRLGVRVPLFVVSPWARRGYVSHETHSHSSVLRFIQSVYDLPALTGRDANSDALLDLFDFRAPGPTPAAASIPAAAPVGCQ